MSFVWLRPEFSPLGVALALGLWAYLVIGEPLLGVRSFNYLRRHRGDDSGALLRVYARTLAIEAIWLIVIGLILLVSPDLEPAALGLRLPTGRLLPGALGFTAFLVVSQIAVAVAFRRGGRTAPAAGDFAYLVPLSGTERRVAALVAIGSGVSEEVMVRGLLIALGVGAMRLPVLVAAVVVTVLFGWLHVYQGWSGVLYATFLGAILACLYLATGSLLLPVLLHVAVNLRALLITTYSGLPVGQQRDQPFPAAE